MNKDEIQVSVTLRELECIRKALMFSLNEDPHGDSDGSLRNLLLKLKNNE